MTDYPYTPLYDPERQAAVRKALLSQPLPPPVLPPAYTELRRRLEAELAKASAAPQLPPGDGDDEAREGVAEGIRISLAWAIGCFEGQAAKDRFEGGEG